MATLTGRSAQATYKDLLKIEAEGNGLPEDRNQLKTVQDGDGSETPLQVARDLVNIDRGLMIGGTAIDVTADEINTIPELLVEISGGTF